MGWRDRDWAKFTDEEWSRLVGTRRAEQTIAVHAPYAAPERKSAHVLSVTLVAAVLSLLATILGMLVHFRTASHVPARSPAPVNVVDVRWRPSDIAPASTAGQICVTTSTLGRVCASYLAGERPADALSGRLQAAGVTVRGS